MRPARGGLLQRSQALVRDGRERFLTGRARELVALCELPSRPLLQFDRSTLPRAVSFDSTTRTRQDVRDPAAIGWRIAEERHHELCELIKQQTGAIGQRPRN